MKPNIFEIATKEFPANANFKPMPANTTTIKIPLKIIT